jgi:hypothetical protein
MPHDCIIDSEFKCPHDSTTADICAECEIPVRKNHSLVGLLKYPPKKQTNCSHCNGHGYRELNAAITKLKIDCCACEHTGKSNTIDYDKWAEQITEYFASEVRVVLKEFTGGK